MEIKSKDFGILKVDKEQIIHFPKGIFAFAEIKDFTLIQKDGYKQKWLQSIAGTDPRFIVFDPEDIIIGYRPEFSPDLLSDLDLAPGEKPSVYVIAVVPENIREMTVNLKSPVLINHEKNLGMQVILEKGDYTVRYQVFQENRGGA